MNRLAFSKKGSERDHTLQNMDRNNIRLGVSESDSPPSSPHANPVHVSTGKNDATQDRASISAETSLISKVIIHPSCVVGVTPSWDLAKKAIEKVEKEFPDDLPYIITYEKKYLGMTCQECSQIVKVGADIANVRKHAFSISHGVMVKRRLKSRGLKEVLTGEVEVRNDNINKSQKEFSQQNLSKDGPLESLDDLDSERQPSKRQRLTPALPVENRDAQSKNYQIAVSVAQASKHSGVSPVVSETSSHEARVRLASVEGKLEEQKNITDNLAKLVPNLEAKLKGQSENSRQMFATIENGLKALKTETDKLMTSFKNPGGLMNMHDATELQYHKRQIENLEQTISTYRSDFNQSIEIQRSQIRATGDRIILSEGFTHALKRELDNLAHSTTDQIANHAAELHKKLEDFTSWVEEQHLSQHTLITKVVEQKMYSIEPIIERVKNMESSGKEKDIDRDFVIDSLVLSRQVLEADVRMLKEDDKTMEMRVADLEENNKNRDCKVVELEKICENLVRFAKSLPQNGVGIVARGGGGQNGVGVVGWGRGGQNGQGAGGPRF